jgi:hypothetical protein
MEDVANMDFIIDVVTAVIALKQKVNQITIGNITLKEMIF